MKELINFYLSILSNVKPILEKYNLYLGGGTALMLKYKHRISYDLDFFCFKSIELERVLREIAFSLPINFDFSLEFPILIISNRRYTTKIEIHIRKNTKLLGWETILGIKKLSDLDILLEKIYFIERKKETDIFDIRFLLKILNLKENEIAQLLREKFNISEEYAKYLVGKLREYLNTN